MSTSSRFVSLDVAVEQSLRIGGKELLRDSHHLLSFVMDMADKTQPQVKLFLKEADEELLAPLASLEPSSDNAQVRTVASRIEDLLANERYVNADLAKSTASEITGGVARYLGLTYMIYHGSKAPQASGHNARQQQERHPNAPKQPRPQTRPSQQRQRQVQGSALQGQGSVSQGQGSVSQGQGSVSQGQGSVSQAQGSVSQGQGSVSQAQGSVSQSSSATTASQRSQAAPQPRPYTPPQPVSPPQPPAKRGHGGIIVAILLACAIVGVAVFFYMNPSKNPLANFSSSVTSTDGLQSDPIYIPSIKEDDSTHVFSKTENDLQFYNISHAGTSSGNTTAVLFVTNKATTEKDVDVTLHFCAEDGSDLSSTSYSITNLAPNQTAVVHADGSSDTYSTYFSYTVYNVRTAGSTSLEGHLAVNVTDQTSSEVTIRLTNTGSTTAHVSWVFAYATKSASEESEGEYHWNSSYWHDENNDPTYENIQPGQSIDVTFPGDWSGFDVNACALGYADA